MKTKKSSSKKRNRRICRDNVKDTLGPAQKAYGDTHTICVNTDCDVRKKTRCYGFQGCPGFRPR